jgi:hypothetical protein
MLLATTSQLSVSAMTAPLILAVVCGMMLRNRKREFVGESDA